MARRSLSRPRGSVSSRRRGKKKRGKVKRNRVNSAVETTKEPTPFDRAWSAYLSRITPSGKSKIEKKKAFRELEKLNSIQRQVVEAVVDKLRQVFTDQEVREIIHAVPGTGMTTYPLAMDGTLERIIRLEYDDGEDLKTKNLSEKDMEYNDLLGRIIGSDLGIGGSIDLADGQIMHPPRPYELPFCQHALVAENGLSLPDSCRLDHEVVRGQFAIPVAKRSPVIHKSKHITNGPIRLNLVRILRDLDDVREGDPRFLHLVDTPLLRTPVEDLRAHIQECIDAYPHWEIVSSELCGFRGETHYAVLRQLPCDDEDKGWVDPETGEVMPIEVAEAQIAAEIDGDSSDTDNWLEELRSRKGWKGRRRIKAEEERRRAKLKALQERFNS